MVSFIALVSKNVKQWLCPILGTDQTCSFDHLVPITSGSSGPYVLILFHMYPQLLSNWFTDFKILLSNVMANGVAFWSAF